MRAERRWPVHVLLARARRSAPSWVWAPVAAAGGLVIWWLVWRGVRLSTRASLVLGAFEVAVFLVLAVTLIVQAGSHNTLQLFTLSFVPHGKGAIPHPKRTVPQAVVFSCLPISLLYLICYYAATVAYGAHRMTGFVNFGAGDPWSALARGAWRCSATSWSGTGQARRHPAGLRGARPAGAVGGGRVDGRRRLTSAAPAGPATDDGTAAGLSVYAHFLPSDDGWDVGQHRRSVMRWSLAPGTAGTAGSGGGCRPTPAKGRAPRPAPAAGRRR